MSDPTSAAGVRNRRQVVTAGLGLVGAGALAAAGRADVARAQSDPYVLKVNAPFNVKDYGAQGDGVANDHNAIEAAVAAAAAAGGGIVFLPPGLYLIGTNGIQIPSHVTLAGSGPNATVLRRYANVGHGIIGVSGTVHAGVRDLTIDGNWANGGAGGMFTAGGHGIAAGAAPCSHLLVQNVVIRNMGGYGIGLQDDGPYVGITVRNVKIVDVKSDGIDLKNDANGNYGNVFDRVWVERPGRTTEDTGNPGIDIRGPAMLSNIVVIGIGELGAQVGIRFRPGSSNGIGGRDSSLRNFYVQGQPNPGLGVNGVQLSGARAVSVLNGTVRDVSTGVAVAASESSAEELPTALHTVVGVHARGCSSAGFAVLPTASDVAFVGCTTDACARGFWLQGDRCTIVSSTAQDASGSPGSGIQLDSGAADCVVVGATLRGNVADVGGTGARTLVADANPAPTPTVVAASTVTLPLVGDLITMTGSSSVNTIAAGRTGRTVTLRFAATATLSDGTGNLRLAGAFAATADDTITLVCDGTNWLEVARSVN